MQARIVVVEQVSYQGAHTLAMSQLPFARLLASDEQPYQRVLTVGEEWQLLDLGWITGKCGMLLVSNQAPMRTTYPTAEETAATSAAVVELQFQGGNGLAHIEVPVGEDVRINPLAPLYVRCRSGRAQIVVTAIPK